MNSTTPDINTTMSNPTITVYSTDQCVKCKMTKKFLEQHHIDFTEVNIDNPEHLQNHGKSREEVISYLKDVLNFRTMPIVETPTDTWSDYRLDKLRSLVTT